MHITHVNKNVCILQQMSKSLLPCNLTEIITATEWRLWLKETVKNPDTKLHI